LVNDRDLPISRARSLELSDRVARSSKKPWLERGAFWGLVALLIVTFFLGGASRADVQSLAILRPAAVLFCGLGLLSLRWEHVQAHRHIFGLAAAIIGLVVLHLVPLPPSIWGALPGREIMTEIDKVATLGTVWRPISMVPTATWNALYSLFVPLAVLLLGAQLNREERYKLLPILLCFGLASGLWGILQTISAPDGPLYLYRVTNNGSAVGLFSNRNHQAMMLATLFPMLAVYASTSVQSKERAGFRVWVALGAGVVMVPLLFVTGSRAGLMLGVMSFLASFLLYRKPVSQSARDRKTKKFDPRVALVAFCALCLGALTIIMARAEAFQRLFDSGQGNDERFALWGPLAATAWSYFPIGSGVGSFIEIYQIDEPRELLSPQYFNHAHNDFLEIFLTTGVPGLVLLGLTLFAVFRRGLQAFRSPLSEGRAISFARLGGIIAAILVLGSVGDYPLRTPSLACVFVIALLWLTNERYDLPKSDGNVRRTPLENLGNE
jgi:O-antigen ligase